MRLVCSRPLSASGCASAPAVRAECLTDRLGAGEAENDEQKPPLRGQSGVSNWHCSTPLAPHLGHGDGALAPAPPQVVIPMISVIIAPPSTWRPPVPQPQKPPPARLDRADLEIVETLRKAGRYGSLVWPLLHEVALTQHPQTRAELRETRLNLWHRLRRLIKAGVVFRFPASRSLTCWSTPWAPLFQTARFSVLSLAIISSRLKTPVF